MCVVTAAVTERCLRRKPIRMLPPHSGQVRVLCCMQHRACVLRGDSSCQNYQKQLIIEPIRQMQAPARGVCPCLAPRAMPASLFKNMMSGP